MTELVSKAYIPVGIFPKRYREHWSVSTYVISEYSFAYECESDQIISHEHSEYEWLRYSEAYSRLKWDSNRTAMYELLCRLHGEVAE